MVKNVIETMLDNLKQYHIVLASNSPRRRELLGGLGIDFQVKVLPDVSENFPENLPVERVAEFIAKEKAEAYREAMQANELIITADTIVVVGSEVLGKPAGPDEARSMLQKLSGCSHQVITGVCLTTLQEQRCFSVTTHVTFKQLSQEEIDYYIATYQPFDKAGAYGIQEWIGYIGVTRLEGSYFNVMGLPVQRIYTELQTFQ